MAVEDWSRAETEAEMGSGGWPAGWLSGRVIDWSDLGAQCYRNASPSCLRGPSAPEKGTSIHRYLDRGMDGKMDGGMKLCFRLRLSGNYRQCGASVCDFFLLHVCLFI